MSGRFQDDAFQLGGMQFVVYTENVCHTDWPSHRATRGIVEG